MKLLILNGPNLNLLGIREPETYGRQTYADLGVFVDRVCKELGVGYEMFQSNYEGALVDEIQNAYGNFDGIVINPAAYTHTSIAILDALKAVALPTVEVHLTDISAREEFRRFSYVSLVAEKVIVGQGFDGYREAIRFFAEKKRD